MLKFKSLHTLIIASLFIISCNPDDTVNEHAISNGFTKNFGSEVSRDFIGQIIDVNKIPIQNVTVTIGNKTVQTDINGVFIINGANVFEKFAHIKATKSGFIDGSRSMIPTSGKNNVRIMLISNAATQSIQSGVASEVTLANGTKVKFDGSFQDSNGNSYSGAVQVSIFHLAPSNENISSLMPGMLYAQDKDGQEKGLETFGMLHVELTGNTGQKLQIASGHTAQMSVQIDNSQLATAPNTIPLWHFDEENGYWKEEGSATKQGNKYVGNVSHFSWWNCDAPFFAVTLTVNVEDAHGNPAENLTVELVRNDSLNSTVGYTNSNGQISGLIPANETLTLSVYASCGVVYTSTIGPFTTSTILPTITISNLSSLSTNVTGNLLKCDNSNVTNGYVILNGVSNYSLISPVNNGVLNLNTIYCAGNTNFTLKGYDFDNFQTTGTITYNFMPNTTIVGNLISCNSISEFISYQVDTNPVKYITDNISANDGTAAGPGFYINHDSNQALFISGLTNTPGIYTTSLFSIISNDFGNISSQSTNAVSFNLNDYGAVGGYIDMTFNGTYNDSSNISHTIHGVVHVRRDN